MRVSMKNQGGVTKRCKVGFSWTTLFFGFFPALFRGDLKWAVIMFVMAGVVGVFTFGLGAWIPGIIFAFVYNQIFMKDLIDKGYYPANDEDKNILAQRQIIAN